MHSDQVKNDLFECGPLLAVISEEQCDKNRKVCFACQKCPGLGKAIAYDSTGQPVGDSPRLVASLACALPAKKTRAKKGTKVKKGAKNG